MDLVDTCNDIRYGSKVSFNIGSISLRDWGEGHDIEIIYTVIIQVIS